MMFLKFLITVTQILNNSDQFLKKAMRVFTLLNDYLVACLSFQEWITGHDETIINFRKE